MAIPIAKTYTATSIGTALKVVRCEHCGKDYVYQVTRKAEGEATSVLFLVNEEAQRHAAQRADEQLQKDLSRAVDVVPCPACGWIQSNMAPLVRRRHLRRAKIAGMVLLFGLVAPIAMLAATLSGGGDEPIPTRMVVELVVIIAAQLVLGMTLLVWRHFACQHLDPNSSDIDERLRQGRELAQLLNDGAKPSAST